MVAESCPTFAIKVSGSTGNFMYGVPSKLISSIIRDLIPTHANTSVEGINGHTKLKTELVDRHDVGIIRQCRQIALPFQIGSSRIYIKLCRIKRPLAFLQRLSKSATKHLGNNHKP